jgi:nitrate/nitrite-specific signal transduction histidine kinase
LLHGGRKGHWGLTGMRERAAKIGGLLKITSSPTAGTEVQLYVPTRFAGPTLKIVSSRSRDL